MYYKNALDNWFIMSYITVYKKAKNDPKHSLRKSFIP